MDTRLKRRKRREKGNRDKKAEKNRNNNMASNNDNMAPTKSKTTRTAAGRPPRVSEVRERYDVGTSLVKHFDGIPFTGKITSNSGRYYKVRYDDGDEEELNHREVTEHIQQANNNKGDDAPAATSKRQPLASLEQKENEKENNGGKKEESSTVTAKEEEVPAAASANNVARMVNVEGGEDINHKKCQRHLSAVANNDGDDESNKREKTTRSGGVVTDSNNPSVPDAAAGDKENKDAGITMIDANNSADLSRKSLDLDDLDDFDLDDFDFDLDLDDLDFLDLDSNPMSIGSTTATSTRLLSSPIREGFWRSTAPSDKTIPSPSGSIISAKPQSMAPVVPRKSLDSDPLSIDSSDRSNRMSLDSETKFLSIMEARVQVGVVETVLEDAGDGAMDGGLNDDAIYMFGSVKDGRGDVGTEKRANSSSSSSSSNKGSSSYSFNNNNNNEKDSGKRKRVQEVDGDVETVIADNNSYHSIDRGGGGGYNNNNNGGGGRHTTVTAKEEEEVLAEDNFENPATVGRADDSKLLLLCNEPHNPVVKEVLAEDTFENPATVGRADYIYNPAVKLGVDPDSGSRFRVGLGYGWNPSPHLYYPSPVVYYPDPPIDEYPTAANNVACRSRSVASNNAGATRNNNSNSNSNDSNNNIRGGSTSSNNNNVTSTNTNTKCYGAAINSDKGYSNNNGNSTTSTNPIDKRSSSISYGSGGNNNNNINLLPEQSVTAAAATTATNAANAANDAATATTDRQPFGTQRQNQELARSGGNVTDSNNPSVPVPDGAANDKKNDDAGTTTTDANNSASVGEISTTNANNKENENNHDQDIDDDNRSTGFFIYDKKSKTYTSRSEPIVVNGSCVCNICLLLPIGEERIAFVCEVENKHGRASDPRFYRRRIEEEYAIYGRLIEEQYADYARCTDRQQKNNIVQSILDEIKNTHDSLVRFLKGKFDGTEKCKSILPKEACHKILADFSSIPKLNQAAESLGEVYILHLDTNQLKTRGMNPMDVAQKVPDAQQYHSSTTTTTTTTTEVLDVDDENEDDDDDDDDEEVEVLDVDDENEDEDEDGVSRPHVYVDDDADKEGEYNHVVNDGQDNCLVVFLPPPPPPQKKDDEGAVVDPAPAPAAKKNRSAENQLTEDDYDASEGDCEVVKLSLCRGDDVDTATCLLMHIGEVTVPVGCLLESVYIRASHLYFYLSCIKEQYAEHAGFTDQQRKNKIIQSLFDELKKGGMTRSTISEAACSAALAAPFFRFTTVSTPEVKVAAAATTATSLAKGEDDNDEETTVLEGADDDYTNIVQCNTKVLQVTYNQYIAEGKLKLEQHKESKKCRLVVRDETVGTVQFNIAINHGMDLFKETAPTKTKPAYVVVITAVLTVGEKPELFKIITTMEDQESLYNALNKIVS